MREDALTDERGHRPRESLSRIQLGDRFGRLARITASSPAALPREIESTSRIARLMARHAEPSQIRSRRLVK